MKSTIGIINFIALIMTFSNAYTQDSLSLIATMSGEQTGDVFSVVAGVGDVNGDGFDDVLVGAPGGNYAKLYFGGSPFDTLADLKFTGEQLQSLFGNHVAGVGDVNRDGYDDILIGAGKAFLYFGSPNMDTIPDFEFVGKYLPQNVGLTVAGAGDVNKHGFDDFIIGVPFNEYDLIGRVYLFFGGATLDTVPAITFVGDAAGQDFFGYGIAGGGDINGDGFDDIIVVAPGGSGEARSGGFYLYSDIVSTTPPYDFGMYKEPGSPPGCPNTDYVYGFMAGTSMATPHVSGLAALILSVNNTLSSGQVRDIIKSSADSLSGESEYEVGAGRINAHQALLNTSGLSKPLTQHESTVVTGFELFNNYPNPFSLARTGNPETEVGYHLPEDCIVGISVYNVLGQKVAELVNESKQAGSHTVGWDGRSKTGDYVSSGLYLYQLRVKGEKGSKRFTQTRKMLLLR